MATNTEKPNANNLPEDKPKETLDPNVPDPPIANPNSDPSWDPSNASSTQPSSLQPPSSNADPTAYASQKEATDPTAATAAGLDSPLSDIQKKKLRAERFGISVQLSEQEKRNSRAERYTVIWVEPFVCIILFMGF